MKEKKHTKQSSPSNSSEKEKKIRYAVIGLGHIAQAAVLPAFSHTKKSELSALVSESDEKLDALRRKYNVEKTFTYDNCDECLQDEAIDAVYIALPNDMHLDCCVRAAEAGKHILCEKPLGLSERECEYMARAAKKNGVLLMTAYRLHFEAANLATMELVRSGSLGDARYFSSTFSYKLKDKKNIRLQWNRGGGALYDLGVYCINAARYLMNDEPKEVFGMLTRSGDPLFDEVDETVTAILRFSRGRVATFTASFGAATSSRYELVGTKGSVVLDPAYEYSEPLKQIVIRNEKPQEKTFPKVDQFGGEIDKFSEYILGNREPEPSADEGIADLRVIDAIFESARTGGSVRLPPFDKQARPTKEQRTKYPPVEEPELVKARSAEDSSDGSS